MPATERTGCDLQTHFDCYKDGQNCIPVELVCNGKNDCGDGQDEEAAICSPKETNPCLNENGGCSQICYHNINGVFCTCNPGFYLKADNKTCEDIDECATLGMCSQMCTNTKGGYKCSCHEGYLLEPSNHHFCKAAGEEPSLIFANRQDIREFKLQSHVYTNLVDKQRSAVALDFVYVTNRLYWSDVAHEQILGIKLTESHHPGVEETDHIVKTNISTPDGIAVDWIHNNLYWTDTGKNLIEVINLDTRMRMTLVSKDLEEPRAIIVDPRDNQG